MGDNQQTSLSGFDYYGKFKGWTIITVDFSLYMDIHVDVYKMDRIICYGILSKALVSEQF